MKPNVKIVIRKSRGGFTAGIGKRYWWGVTEAEAVGNLVIELLMKGSAILRLYQGDAYFHRSISSDETAL